MITKLTKNLLLSAMVGFSFFFLVKVLWGYIPNINPVTNALFSCCTARSWFVPVIYAHDILINILLCIPFAVFLIKLIPNKLWLYTASALIPSFVYGNYHLLFPEYSSWTVSSLALNWAIELLCLPIALLLVFFWRKRSKTNKHSSS